MDLQFFPDFLRNHDEVRPGHGAGDHNSRSRRAGCLWGTAHAVGSDGDSLGG